jgi:hypothetical protein
MHPWSILRIGSTGTADGQTENICLVRQTTSYGPVGTRELLLPKAVSHRLGFDRATPLAKMPRLCEECSLVEATRRQLPYIRAPLWDSKRSRRNPDNKATHAPICRNPLHPPALHARTDTPKIGTARSYLHRRNKREIVPVGLMTRRLRRMFQISHFPESVNLKHKIDGK